MYFLFYFSFIYCGAGQSAKLIHGALQSQATPILCAPRKQLVDSTAFSFSSSATPVVVCGVNLFVHTSSPLPGRSGVCRLPLCVVFSPGTSRPSAAGTDKAAVVWHRTPNGSGSCTFNDKRILPGKNRRLHPGSKAVLAKGVPPTNFFATRGIDLIPSNFDRWDFTECGLSSHFFDYE